MRDGPDGLRLQAIAADLGIAHSSILHHFGSREGLVEALSTDALDALARDLGAALNAANEETRARSLLARVASTLRDQGHARLLAWQITSGRLRRGLEDPEREESSLLLARIAEVVHRVRTEFATQHGVEQPDLRDTRFFVLMVAYTLFGQALAGDVFTNSVGIEPTDEEHEAFLEWFSERSQAIAVPANQSSNAKGDSDD